MHIIENYSSEFVFQMKIKNVKKMNAMETGKMAVVAALLINIKSHAERFMVTIFSPVRIYFDFYIYNFSIRFVTAKQ